jgi:hypothetical protein
MLFGSTDAFNISRTIRDRGYDTSNFLDRQRAETNAQLTQRTQFLSRVTNTVSQNPVDIRSLSARISTTNQTPESILSNQPTIAQLNNMGIATDESGNPIGNP